MTKLKTKKSTISNINKLTTQAVEQACFGFSSKMIVSEEQEEEEERCPKPKQHHSRPPSLHLCLLLFTVLVAALFIVTIFSFLTSSPYIDSTHNFDLHFSEIKFPPERNRNPTLSHSTTFPPSSFTADLAPPLPPLPQAVIKSKPNIKAVDTTMEESGPYHNWQLFVEDFKEMMRNFKIYVYPDATNQTQSQFGPIFLPHQNPFDPKLGNYFSEHMFKLSLLQSSLLTLHPQQAHLFFLPFSINLLRNDPRVHSEASISEFVSQYITRIRRDFTFWNASAGANHFYVYCHSVGREAASKFLDLRNNAIQVTCSSSYFQRYYVTHKDVALPQVWPRSNDQPLTPPDARYSFLFTTFFHFHLFVVAAAAAAALEAFQY